MYYSRSYPIHNHARNGPGANRSTDFQGLCKSEQTERRPHGSQGSARNGRDLWDFYSWECQQTYWVVNMPYYEYICPDHGAFDLFQKMSEERKGMCPKCGIPSRFHITGVSFKIDFKPGWDAGFGKWIDTKKQRENLLAEKGWSKID